MRTFQDMTLKEFFDLLEEYAKCQDSLLERVEFNFWQQYEPVVMLTRGGKPGKFISPRNRSKLEQVVMSSKGAEQLSLDLVVI